MEQERTRRENIYPLSFVNFNYSQSYLDSIAFEFEACFDAQVVRPFKTRARARAHSKLMPSEWRKDAKLINWEIYKMYVASLSMQEETIAKERYREKLDISALLCLSLYRNNDYFRMVRSGVSRLSDSYSERVADAGVPSCSDILSGRTSDERGIPPWCAAVFARDELLPCFQNIGVSSRQTLDRNGSLHKAPINRDETRAINHTARARCES